MHAVTRDADVAVPTRTGQDARAAATPTATSHESSKLNLRAEGPEVRSARRAVAAYLTACGFREPDDIATHTRRVVTEVTEAALLAERRIPADLADRALAQIGVEYLRTTRSLAAEASAGGPTPKTATPAHCRMILGGLPQVWDGAEPAVARAAGYLQQAAVVIVPAESPRSMAPPAFGTGRPGPAARFLAAAAARIRHGLVAAERVAGRVLRSPQTS
ncbi:MAG: hypothetical protein AAF532_15800 [Planctomycetota bacterium]